MNYIIKHEYIPELSGFEWKNQLIRLPDNVTYQLKFKSGKQWKNVLFMNDCKIK